ncbi:hypothetical protein J2X65_004893 [Ancylobacter sp. 3268]|uniref:hypothetical protein n=1 Tax=Ancylobacter sp. 3268 TaxID=2817752 RepID=UPI00285D9AE1|nr:hypothetical protein [Ancylobacter sp. 3268]MDR6955513.1 hypothetical protein [Ancylobacter sp. 3268]
MILQRLFILTLLDPVVDCGYMDNDDIQQLITELRRMLVDNGFGWVVDEAETELYPTVALRTRALALIDATEGVTVNLAEIELRTLDVLEVEGVEFKPDEEDRPDGGVLVDQASGVEAIRSADRLRGAERRAKLKQLAEQRFAFQVLRRRLDGDE